MIVKVRYVKVPYFPYRSFEIFTDDKRFCFESDCPHGLRLSSYLTQVSKRHGRLKRKTRKPPFSVRKWYVQKVLVTTNWVYSEKVSSILISYLSNSLSYFLMHIIVLDEWSFDFKLQLWGNREVVRCVVSKVKFVEEWTYRDILSLSKYCYRRQFWSYNRWATA